MQNPPLPAETRAVFNIAYRIGTALERKFESTDMTTELRQAARLYAATYDGDFDYMLGMRDQVIGRNFLLTDNQCKAILNCLMADAKRRLAAKPQAAPRAAAAAHVTLASVPDGRYRVTLPSSEHLALKITLAGADSKLNGSRVISTRVSGDDWMGVAHITPAGELRIWRSCAGALRERVSGAVTVLDNGTTEDAWLVAGLAFAQAGSECFFCGRALDTPESLAAGYGPTCADKHGLPWGARVIPMSVRLAQAAEATASAAVPTIDPETGVEETADELLALARQTAPRLVAPTVYMPRPYLEDPAIVADRARDKLMIAQAKAEGRPRTYNEIFGEDL